MGFVDPGATTSSSAPAMAIGGNSIGDDVATAERTCLAGYCCGWGSEV
jgi:hypothetical protein